MNYQQAKRLARKPRDIWIRKLVLDHLATPLAFLAIKLGLSPTFATLTTFLIGLCAATAFGYQRLGLGAILYLAFLLTDSIDGRINRMLEVDDTVRGMQDFVLDGLVCTCVTIGLAVGAANVLLTVLLLVWMSFHYLVMRFSSAIYRIKVQIGERDVWMINNEEPTSLFAAAYKRFVNKYHTYPHPTVGEAVFSMFVVGPLTYHFTNEPWYLFIGVVVGILFTLPETFGSLILLNLKVKGISK